MSSFKSIFPFSGLSYHLSIRFPLQFFCLLALLIALSAGHAIAAESQKGLDESEEEISITHPASVAAGEPFLLRFETLCVFDTWLPVEWLGKKIHLGL